MPGVPAPGPGLTADFRRLWGASLASNLADGVVVTSLPLAAVSLTSDPVLVAAVTAAASVPPVLLVLLAGVAADRVAPRRLMVAVQVLRVAVLAGLVTAALTGALSIPVLAAAAFGLSIGATFYDTTAQSILPMVTGDVSLTRANTRLYTAEVLSDSFVGPPLGGALVAVGLPLAFGGAAIGYGLAVVGLALMTGTFRVQRTRPAATVRGDIGEGLGYLVRHRLQRTLTAMVAMGNFATGAMYAVLVLYVVAPGPMGLDGIGYGLLLTAMGAGSLLGSILPERLERRFGTARTLVFAAIAYAVAFLVPALTAEPLAVGAAFFAAGITIIVWNVVNVSLRQRFIPAELYGRVHAGHRLVVRASYLAGSVGGGLVAASLGLPAVFAMGAVVVLASGLGGLVVTDPAVEHALAGRPGGPATGGGAAADA